jgi:ElaB/YqjD/DUF883 family membrane-anchored ribosome-binding protein
MHEQLWGEKEAAMFAMNGAKRTREAERITTQAWENLVSRVDSATATARSAKRRASGLANEAQSRVGHTADEARWRANAALDALAGRRPPRPWSTIATAAAIGAVLGLITTEVARRALARPDFDVDVPDHLAQAGTYGSGPLVNPADRPS